MTIEEFREKIKESEIKFVEEDKINYYFPVIELILDKIADAAKNSGIRMALVTDLSSISDFSFDIDDDESFLSELSDQFGFEVQFTDLLVDIAEKLMRQI